MYMYDDFKSFWKLKKGSCELRADTKIEVEWI